MSYFKLRILPVFILVCAFAFSSCNQSPPDTSEVKDTRQPRASSKASDSLATQILAMEKALYNTPELNKDLANRMIRLYETFFQRFHALPETADYLYKAGELAENTKQPYRAIGYYTHCYEEYPQYKLRAESLFRMASLNDLQLNNYTKAKALYLEVKTQYPNSYLAKDADGALKMMGKTDAETVREFEKKNGIKR